MARGSNSHSGIWDGAVSATAVNDAVSTASRLLVAVSARSIESVDESMTLARFRMLVMLSERGPLNPSVLAHYLGVTAATVTRMINKLVTAGLVSKRPNPLCRREVVVGLTTAGAAVVARISERRHAEIAQIVARMPERSQRDLVAVLEAFNEAGERTPADTGTGGVAIDASTGTGFMSTSDAVVAEVMWSR
jgi:DNA-binding MarR family transcriptional regulator